MSDDELGNAIVDALLENHSRHQEGEPFVKISPTLPTGEKKKAVLWVDWEIEEPEISRPKKPDISHKNLVGIVRLLINSARSPDVPLKERLLI